MMNRALIAGLVIALAVSSQRASAQDLLADAKALYDDAMYEEALKHLDRMAADANLEVHKYRALCLIALGRSDAAEREIAIVVGADPFFTPDSEEVSPRVVSMFDAARRKLLPPMVRRTFAEATELFRGGSRQRAMERFDEVVRLMNDPTLASDQGLADLKLVAGAFVELVRVQAAPAAAAPAVAPTEQPDPPAAKPIEAARVPVITPPVAITQVFPRWNPPDSVAAKHAFSGAIKLVIDKEGRVVGASRQRTAHPAYDRIVLEAARGWLYKPATRDGEPINSETTVEIQLVPNGN